MSSVSNQHEDRISGASLPGILTLQMRQYISGYYTGSDDVGKRAEQACMSCTSMGGTLHLCR